MATATITSPDGKTATLTIPDGASPEQIRTAGDRAKAAMSQVPGAQPAAPQAAPPAAPTEDIKEPPVYSPGGLGVGTAGEPGLAGTALYRGFVRPAAELSGLAHKYLGVGASPEEFRDAATGLGLPGAANLPGAAPEGVLGDVGAALSPLEVFVPSLWGIGTLGHWTTDNEAVGDAIEGAAGLYQATRAGIRWWTGGGRETAQDVLNVGRRAMGIAERPTVPKELRGRSVAEQAFLQQEKQVGAAKSVAARAEQAHVESEALAARTYAKEQEYTRAAMRAQNAVEARAAATQNRVEAIKLKIAEAQDAREIPEQALRVQLGLGTAAPDARQAGELLTDTETGLRGMRQEARSATSTAYANANRIADEQGVALSMQSETAINILDRALDWAQRAGKYASQQERDAIKAILDDVSTADQLAYSRYNDLFARVSSIALNPREYAASAGPIAREEFTRFKNALATGLRVLETASPELQDAARAARSSAAEGARVRQTVKSLVHQTPEDAFRAMTANPTHLRRVMTRAGAAEQDAYRMAYWSDLVASSTDLNGMTDTTKVLKAFTALPEESRTLLASGVTQEARTSMLRLAAGEKDTAVLRASRRNAEKIVRDTLRELAEVKRVWTKAAERAGSTPHQFGELIDARRLAIDAKKEAAIRLGDAKAARAAVADEQKLLEQLGGLTRSGQPPRNTAESLQLYHTMKTVQGLLSGNPAGFTSAAHGTFAYLLSRRAPLIRDTIKLPVNSPGWRATAGALNAATRGWRGFVENETPDLMTPGQAAPIGVLR